MNKAYDREVSRPIQGPEAAVIACMCQPELEAAFHGLSDRWYKAVNDSLHSTPKDKLHRNQWVPTYFMLGT